jgi:hypothetical protein
MVNDQFGIKLLYPSSETNEQYLALPKSLSLLEQSGILQNKITGLDGTFVVNAVGDTIYWYEYDPASGNDVKMLLLPSSLTGSDGEITLDVNCDLSHEEAANQGYVNDSGEWQNVEMTSHFFIKTVDSPKGYLFIETRNGYDGTKGGCCQGTAYGVRLYWDTGVDKGKFAFYKKEFTNSLVDLGKQSQTRIPTFYQEWFGAKFCVYNTAAERVKIELWLTPVVFLDPANPNSNLWTKVGEVEDYPGRNWTRGGDECDAPAKDFPITWAAPFSAIGWQDGNVIQFQYTSAREIDKDGTFGEDPIPDPDPVPDPTIPNPDPEPPTTPDPQPPDAEPPQTSTTLTRRLTLRREIVNNRLCSCDGIQAEEPEVPPGGGTGGGGGGGGGSGGGGGGTGTLITLYNVALNTSSFARLASQSGSSSLYLRFGQGVTQSSSAWIGKTINRVEITLAKQGNPTGATGGGVHCRIRKGTDDSIAATLTPIAAESNITTAGTLCVFENLTNTYKLVFGDILLFEYDGGDTSNYIKVFMTEQPVTTGTKILWQANDMDAGDYDDEPSLDICARVYTTTP